MVEIREMRFCPYCGTELESIVEEGMLRPTCPACGFRQYANPVPAVNAAIVRDGRIVLVRRGREPYIGRWVLPGGFIEWDEDPVTTTVREAKEETGLDVQIAGPGVFLLARDDPRTNTVSATYPAVPSAAGHPAPIAGDDAADADWFDLDDLPPLGFENHGRALRNLGFVE